jgi:hypothetical protein
MKRPVILLTCALAVGIALGLIGSQVLSAQQMPIKRAVLLNTDLPGLEGQEFLIDQVELAPGVVGGKHYHLGNMFVYILEGSGVLESTESQLSPRRRGVCSMNPPSKCRTSGMLARPSRSSCSSCLSSRRASPSAFQPSSGNKHPRRPPPEAPCGHRKCCWAARFPVRRERASASPRRATEASKSSWVSPNRKGVPPSVCRASVLLRLRGARVLAPVAHRRMSPPGLVPERMAWPCPTSWSSKMNRLWPSL